MKTLFVFLTAMLLGMTSYGGGLTVSTTYGTSTNQFLENPTNRNPTTIGGTNYSSDGIVKSYVDPILDHFVFTDDSGRAAVEFNTIDQTYSFLGTISAGAVSVNGGVSIIGDGATLSLDGATSSSDGPYRFDTTVPDTLTIRTPLGGGLTFDSDASTIHAVSPFTFAGDGSEFTSLNAGNLIGTVPQAALGIKFFTNAISSTALAYTNSNTFLATSIRVFIVCTNNDSASKYSSGDWTPIESWGDADLLSGAGLALQLSASTSNIVLSLEQALTTANWKVVPKGGGTAVAPSSMVNFKLITKASQF